MHAQFYRTRPTDGTAAQALTKEDRMNSSRWIRQGHRWVAMLFTLLVIANFAAYAFGQPPMWLVYAPLPPLFLLMFSGLFMFFQPYVARRRARRPVLAQK